MKTWLLRRQYLKSLNFHTEHKAVKERNGDGFKVEGFKAYQAMLPKNISAKKAERWLKKLKREE